MAILGKVKELFTKAPKVSAIEATVETHPIKGNVNAKNQKIYHVPDGKFYEMVKDPQEVFVNEEEAEAAGYRKSRQ